MGQHKWFKLGIGMLLGSAIAPLLANHVAAPAQADNIIINAPIIIQDRRRPRHQEVIVDFVARGDEWANVYLDGRRVFTPTNPGNRRRRLRLQEGAYDIKITGIDYFDVWAEGYLDVGRDDVNIIVVSFAENGSVRVSGDPYAWIPVSTARRRRR